MYYFISDDTPYPFYIGVNTITNNITYFTGKLMGMFLNESMYKSTAQSIAFELNGNVESFLS